MEIDQIELRISELEKKFDISKNKTELVELYQTAIEYFGENTKAKQYLAKLQ